MASTCKRRAEKLYLEYDDLGEVFDPRQYFPQDKPLGLEIGIGKGRFLRDWTTQKKHMALMGVEIKKDRANRAALKLEDAGLYQSYVMRSDVKKLFGKLHPDVKYQAIHLNFPDPWPKKRHAKHRMLHPAFVELYVKHLAPGGSLVFVTDDPDYAVYGQESLRAQQQLVDVFDGIRLHWPCYPVSIHEEKFRQWGRNIHYQKFTRKLK